MAFVQEAWTSTDQIEFTNSNSLTVVLPGGMVAGNLCVLYLPDGFTSQSGNGWTTASPATPAGWSGSAGRYRRTLDGTAGDANPVFTWTAGNGHVYGGYSVSEWTQTGGPTPAFTAGTANNGTTPRTDSWTFENEGALGNYGALYFLTLQTTDVAQTSIASAVPFLATNRGNHPFAVYSVIGHVWTKTREYMWQISSYTLHNTIMPSEVFSHPNDSTTFGFLNGGDRWTFPQPLDGAPPATGSSDVWGWTG